MTPGITIFGTPVGSDAYMSAVLHDKVATVKTNLRKLVRMENAHILREHVSVLTA